MLILSVLLCIIWILAFLLITWGVGTLDYLRDVPPYSGLDISVSVVVAARNEAETIEEAVLSLLAQDYPDYEVIVANDRSTDATGEILERIAREHPRLKIVHVHDLSAEWLGKNQALHLGAQLAHGDYILFTDADVVMQPSTLARAVMRCETDRLDHIAVFPDVPAPDYWTGAYFTLFGLGFLMLMQPWFARNGRTPLSVGIGAFNFVRRSKYEQAGGHTGIRLRPDDDIAIAYKLRQAGARHAILIGRGLILVRWYPDLTSAIRGLEKNALAPFEYSLPLVAIVTILHFVSYVAPWLGLFAGGRITLVCGIAVIAQMMTLASTGPIAEKTWRYAPVTGLAALVFEYAVLRAVFLTFRHGGIRWRDTFYPLHLLRTNRMRD